MTGAPTATRRGLLGTALLAPLATAACLAPAAAASPASNLPALIAKLDAADAAYADFAEQTFGAAWKRLNVALAAVPHATTSTTYRNLQGEPRRPTTADASVVAVAKTVIRDKPTWAWDEDYRTVCAELLELCEARKMRLAEVRERSGIDAVEAESDRLEDALNAALRAIETFAAQSLPELTLKMDTLQRYGALDVDAINADVRRLAGEARA